MNVFLHHIELLSRWMLFAFVLTLCTITQQASAQIIPDTLARVRVTNIGYNNVTALEFDLVLERTSEYWLNWANGTFQVVLPNWNPPAGTQFELLPGTSDLPPEPIYQIRPEIVRQQKFSISVLGPKRYDECIRIDSSVRVGRFRISIPETGGGIVPYNVEWVSPLEKYQASAFKNRDENRLIDIFTYSGDDNVEMFERIPENVKFDVDRVETGRMEVVDFRAIYMGRKNIELTWNTTAEAFNRGFVITRGILPFGQNEVSDEFLEELTVVARYQDNAALLPKKAQLVVNEPSDYLTTDRSEIRDVVYVYKLYSEDYDGNLRYHGFSYLEVPNAIISFAKASPNPFTEITNVEYVVDDAVRLSVRVNDNEGKLVKIIYENEVVERNTINNPYVIQYIAPGNASAGLYQMVFIAEPIDDNVIKRSTANVKLQLIR